MTEGTACRLSPLLGFSESILLGEYEHYSIGNSAREGVGVLVFHFVCGDGGKC